MTAAIAIAAKPSIGFTGTQKGMTDKQKKVVRDLFITPEVFQGAEGPGDFHHGDCIGADAEAHLIVRESGHAWTIISHPPINESKRAFMEADILRPPKEYLERNRDIVDESRILIAAPGSEVEELRSGTWSTIRYAKKQHMILIIVYPQGKTEFSFGLKGKK